MGHDKYLNGDVLAELILSVVYGMYRKTNQQKPQSFQ